MEPVSPVPPSSPTFSEFPLPLPLLSCPPLLVPEKPSPPVPMEGPSEFENAGDDPQRTRASSSANNPTAYPVRFDMWFLGPGRRAMTMLRSSHKHLNVTLIKVQR